MKQIGEKKPRLNIKALLLAVPLLGSCNTGQSKTPGVPSAAMPVVQSQQPSSAREDTLFHSIGGASGLEELSTEFIRELAADVRVRHYYKHTDIGRFHRMMKLYVCELADGPCVYTGDDMKRTHGGMNITSAEFNAVVEAMMRAMDTVGMNAGTQNRMLAIIAPLRGDIVGQ